MELFNIIIFGMRKIYHLKLPVERFNFVFDTSLMFIFSLIIFLLIATDLRVPRTVPCVIVNNRSSFNLNDYYSNLPELDARTDSVFKSLTDHQRISQLIMTSAGKKGKPFSIVRDLVNDGVTGGVLFLGGSSGKLSQRINELKDVVTSSGNLHLLISSDAEPSLINRRISGISQFKNTNEIHSVIEAYKIGSKIAGEIKAIGFNYNFAPVCDFPFNREIIGNRSFWGDIDSIPKFVSAFIKGTQENNIIATAKHFPGHGNITGDSHKQLVTISGEMKELEVFRSAIDAGVISVMVGHIRVSDNDYSTDGLPSTLSKRIVSDLLRDSLEFRGIIVTDAMNMGALREFPNASLEAVRAGCDLIIMPPDERKLHSQIIELISSDENYKQQVFASVKRILRAKICLGLI